MYKILLLLVSLLTLSIVSTEANHTSQSASPVVLTAQDSTRLAELDAYWAQLSKTVREGDFEGYEALYHDDAVVVFAVGENKTSIPIAKALAGWKQGFKETKEGKRNDNVQFRFSQRIGDETSAHETGLFLFTSEDSDGNVLANSVIHLEMLLIKTEDGWLSLMEYQISKGTMEAWEALE